MENETVSKNFIEISLIKIWQKAFMTSIIHDSRRSQTDIFISDMQNPFF